jgi:hypothetical protein
MDYQIEEKRKKNYQIFAYSVMKEKLTSTGHWCCSCFWWRNNINLESKEM